MGDPAVGCPAGDGRVPGRIGGALRVAARDVRVGVLAEPRCVDPRVVRDDIEDEPDAGMLEPSAQP